MHRLSEIVSALVSPRSEQGPPPIVDVAGEFDEGGDPARSLNAAFLIAAAGDGHPRVGEARDYLGRMVAAEDWAGVASFYREGLRLMSEELDSGTSRDPGLRRRVDDLVDFLTRDEVASAEKLAESMWAVFHPEAVGIRGREEERAAELRRRRTIEITSPGPGPVTDPAGQVLLTANVLLTGPPDGREIDELDLAEDVKEGLRSVEGEPQRFWFDHPIQIGVEPSGSELLYGLGAMERGLAFEKERGTMESDQRLRLALSVSTTHDGLEAISRRYLEDEIRRMGGPEHLETYLFTESDTERLLDEVLVPAAESFLGRAEAADLLRVFGVRGRYGRHHSFGKAIAALWNVLIDPEVVATFKTDLDHSWPQEELVRETGTSLLEHFRFPLWGGAGVDANGQALDLGGMAGALVNESDIDRGLFTPDVPFPDRPPGPDELVFFSPLTQALSTLAEASTRYGPRGPDGVTTAIERLHIHGGTAGVLVDSLRRHRPFTPSFIARAEDQAYVLSLYGEPAPRLAYVHNRELIQRHDKKGFASAAIEASRLPTMIGDYERILLFSKLADAVTKDREGLKRMAAPFTGSFISDLPITVVYLRFALKAAGMFAAGDEEGARFVSDGAERLTSTLAFVGGDPSELEVRYRAEREGWDLFFETLDALEKRLLEGDARAVDLAGRAREIVARSAVLGA